ncbi:MAG: hypothetical protein GY755_22135 [Chloroflexi bacterium]|nr:hypothetical protein [Chloroflexota bacterium]
MNAVEKNQLNAQNAVAGTMKQTHTGMIVKLEKVASLKDARRRNMAIDPHNFSAGYPYKILAAYPDVYGKIKWEIIEQIDTIENARFCFDELVNR